MEWFVGPIPGAISSCKEMNGLLIVFIRDDGDDSSSVEEAFRSEAIGQYISGKSYKALRIIKDSVEYTQFNAIYPVIVLPSVFIILSKTGIPLQILKGRISESDLVGKLKLSFEKQASMEAVAQHSSVSQEADKSLASSETVEPPIEQITKEERIRKAEELIQKNKRIKQAQQLELERERELRRRSQGKDLADAKLAREEVIKKTWIMERAKEREDERKARAEILAKVEQDKINRKKVQESKPAAGSSSASVSHFGESKRRMRTGTMEDSTEVKSSVTSISENARIQFRLLDGTIITEQFKSSDQLIKVREFIAEYTDQSVSSFALSSTFPSKLLPTEDDDKTLSELKLSPSAVLIVTTAKKVERDVNGVFPRIVAFFLWLFSIVVSFFKYIWGLLSRSAAPSNTQASFKERNQRKYGRKALGRDNFKHFKPNNEQDSDEDDEERRKTDNGNSTQQQ